MDDNEKTADFIRRWKEYWPRPTDWTDREVQAGTSSLISWLRHLKRESYELTWDVLIAWERDEYGPRFANFESSFKARKRSRTGGESGPVTGDCPDCRGTGMITFAMVHRDGRTVPLTEPIPSDRVYLGNGPCRCAVGDNVNARMFDLSGNSRLKMFQARITPVAFVKFQRQCHKLAGNAVADPPARDDDGLWAKVMLEKAAKFGTDRLQDTRRPERLSGLPRSPQPPQRPARPMREIISPADDDF